MEKTEAQLKLLNRCVVCYLKFQDWIYPESDKQLEVEYSKEGGVVWGGGAGAACIWAATRGVIFTGFQMGVRAHAGSLAMLDTPLYRFYLPVHRFLDLPLVMCVKQTFCNCVDGMTLSVDRSVMTLGSRKHYHFTWFKIILTTFFFWKDFANKLCK